jgi:hypothetical protein
MTPNPDVVWVTRLVGGSILGFATLMFFGRKSTSSEAHRAIALGFLVNLLRKMEIKPFLMRFFRKVSQLS